MTDSLVDSAKGLCSATLHEAAGRTGALPSSIKPLSPETALCGRAFPVRSSAGDNLYIHHGIYAASAGDVLVVDCGEAAEFGYWGEVMARAALARGIAGLVISGGVRDSRQMLAMGFPVFAANICIRGTGKDPEGQGSVARPITIGDVRIMAGDLVVGDADGVMVVAAADAEAAVAESRRRDRAEEALFRQLDAGATTLRLYGLPAPKGG